MFKFIILFLTVPLLAISPNIKPYSSTKYNYLKITQRAGKYRFMDNNGRLIRNYKFANKSIKVSKFNKKIGYKYNKPIKFNKFGYPDFSNYAKYEIKTTKLTGNHLKDVKIANKLAKKKYKNWKKIPNYTWHHHQDGKTMQYVPKDLHKAIPHSGGASRLRVLKKIGDINGKKRLYWYSKFSFNCYRIIFCK